MREGDLGRVQRGAFEAAERRARLSAAAARSSGAVHRVAGDRVAGVGQMDAGLVGAAGVEADADEGRERQLFEGPGFGLGLPRVPAPAAIALPVLRIAPDGFVHPAVFPEPAHHQGQVLLFHLPLREGFGEPQPRRLGAGGDQHAARAPVQAMDQPGPSRRTDSRDLRVSVDQAVRQGPLPVTGARVHHESRRFVDHDQPRIFVENGERHRFRGQGVVLAGGAEARRAAVPGALTITR